MEPTYDLLLQNGHLLDPKTSLDGPADVAIKNGRIAEIWTYSDIGDWFAAQ